MKHPLLYEINTRCWLPELSRKYGREVTLDNLPDSTFARWQNLGFTHIWLMGVWTSGERSRSEALANPYLQRAYAEVLPDWQAADVSGSPYAIADYHVPPDATIEASQQDKRVQVHVKFTRPIVTPIYTYNYEFDHTASSTTFLTK